MSTATADKKSANVAGCGKKVSIDPLGRHGHELHAQKLLLALVFRVLASPSFDVEIGNDGSRCVGWAELTSLFSVRRERQALGL